MQYGTVKNNSRSQKIIRSIGKRKRKRSNEWNKIGRIHNEKWNKTGIQPKSITVYTC